MHESIAKLMLDDVIVICSAGNNALERDQNGALRSNVDTAPAVFETDDYPLIVVGATDFAGNEADFSQKGDKVKILAPGAGIHCLEKGQRDPSTTPRDGTSYCKFFFVPSLPN